MLNDFNDKAKYERKIGEDSSLNNIYAPVKTVNVNWGKGKDVLVQTKQGIVTEHRRLCRAPFEMKEGDKIDGHIVVEVETPVKDLNGVILRYKAWVK